ncbi:kelch-like protein 23 [Lampris incognitus]|uniref:kelch-like protein 23 n=1 Tax=Lampris incognitus TaxID=2546036 RepID=UPI0024B508C1|nr:kelch-like protein 23 [Lampris incognitus]
MTDERAESYTYDFHDEQHPGEMLAALEQLYVGGVLTDVALRCASGEEFRCHRALLCAGSRYFRAMFTSDMRERSDGLVGLAGVDREVLGALLSYTYTARLLITEGNVQRLLEAADRLQFGRVKGACEDFLVRFLDAHNCLGMHAFAQLHACPALEREARRVALSRFDDVIQQEEFLDLEPGKVRAVLSAKNLNAREDDALIGAVAKWVAHDSADRLRHVPDLLGSVHLDVDELGFKAALDVQGRSSLRGEGAVRSVIVQALKGRREGITASSGKVSPILYVVGGYYWHPLSELHKWDPASNEWTQGKGIPDHTRESYSVAILGANIYVTGGYRSNTVEALDAVSVYNCDRDEWTAGCPMTTARYYHCSVALRGCVYAVGGYRAGAPERRAEYYDPLKKRWFPVADMIQGVGNATACVMADNIYVTGGHYGYRGSTTFEEIQVYRQSVNEWSIITISPHPEYGLCSVSLDNKLYLVGGQTAIADCYDLERNEWRQVSMMKERRMECGAVVINGCIYVTGGYSYSKGTYLQNIEKYDPELDSWEIVGTLPSPARGHGCVCVYSV